MKHYLHVLKNYVNFSGRARRAEFWQFMLVNVIIMIILIQIGLFAGNDSGFLFLPIYQLIVLLPSLAVTVRRIHDTGRSGIYILIPIYSLIVACQEGKKGENQYGPDPKNREYDIKDHLVN